MVKMSIMKNVTTAWNKYCLHEILVGGTKLYSQISKSDGDVKPVDLPTPVSFAGKNFQVKLFPSVRGNLDRSMFGDDASLGHALKNALLVSKNCILVMGSVSVSVVEKQGLLFQFDSHGRNNNGLPAVNGACVRLQFNHITQLVIHLHRLVCSLQLSDEPFEIIPVGIRKMCSGFQNKTTCDVSDDLDKSATKQTSVKTPNRGMIPLKKTIEGGMKPLEKTRRGMKPPKKQLKDWNLWKRPKIKQTQISHLNHTWFHKTR